MNFKYFKKLKFTFYIFSFCLITVFGQSCDSVNTDSAETSVKAKYPKTNTGTFPAKMHFKTLSGGTYKYWNENLGTKWNGEVQKLACSGSLPVNPYYYNLNDQDPEIDLAYKYSLGQNLIPATWSKIMEWPMSGDVNTYSDEQYEVHSWLRDSFGKPLYAGSDNIFYDTTAPVFEETKVVSNAVTLDLVINDLTFDFKSFIEDPAYQQISIDENFALGQPPIPCIGKIQLSDDNFTSCIPFTGLPVWGIKNDNITQNRLRIQAPELAESADYYLKIQGPIRDCAGNTTLGDQSVVFRTEDFGGPGINRLNFISNNTLDTKRAKQGDSISLKIQFSERVSDRITNPGQPKDPPKVKFTVNGVSNIVNASLDSGDFTGKNWTATFDTSSWTSPTSQGGDNVSFEVYDYWDLNQDEFGYAANKGIKIKSSWDNLTDPDPNGYEIIYDEILVQYDNVQPNSLNTISLLSSNPLVNIFRSFDKAYLDFQTDEPIYVPEIKIGGHDNVTIRNANDNISALFNDNITWYAEKFYLPSFPDNNSVTADILIRDLSGNSRSITSNSIIFDNTLDNLTTVSINSTNELRIDNGSIPTNLNYFAKKDDNISINFLSNEAIRILNVKFDNENFDNTSTSIINTSADNWVFTYTVSDNKSHVGDSPTPFEITYTDLAGNDNVTITSTTNNSFIYLDNIPPTIDNLSIISNNRNNKWAKSGDSIFVSYFMNERIKNSSLTCWNAPSFSSSTSCNDATINMFGDDNSTTLATIQNILDNGSVNDQDYVASRVFQTSTPITKQDGDNVTFQIILEDYAGNQLIITHDNLTDSNVKYDDQIPSLTTIEIDSDNVNSAFQNVTPDKQLAKSGDNLTLTLVVPELVEFLNLEFLSDNVTDNLSTTDNLSFSFLRQMYDNDTSKNFYTADCTSPYNPQTGCKIRYDIEAIDFAGNISTHDESNTTDNSTVKFDNILDNLTTVSIKSTNELRIDNGSTPAYLNYFAKKDDNVSITFLSNETINILNVKFDNENFDNMSTNIINTSGDNWLFTYTVSDNKSHVGNSPTPFEITYTDLAGNDNITITSTTNNSFIYLDNIPPTIDNLSIISNNRNNKWAKSGDRLFVNYYMNERIKNSTLRCWNAPSFSSSTACSDATINMFGDDNSSTLATIQNILDNGSVNDQDYVASRVFQTSTPITKQDGDNVTFQIILEDYAGNQLIITHDNLTDNNVKYDDQIPSLTTIEIDSDNVNSATENVTPDKQLAKPDDNLTLSLVVPELVEFLNLEFLSDNVTDNLSTSDNLSFSFLRQMYDNDTSKNFYTADCTSPFNPQTGCKIRYDIEAIDFAGNISTHGESNTTDNSTVKFDGISPSTPFVNFQTDNCNSFAGKVGDNATLSVRANEPIYIPSIITHYLNLPDNFTISNGDIALLPDNLSVPGDLDSFEEFKTSRIFQATDHQSNSLVGADPINFYTYFTDPAGNEFSFNTTTDGTSIIFDRIPPTLDNVSITTDSDTSFEYFVMSGSLLNIDFTANEELRRRVDPSGINANTTRNNCTGTCCINPYVLRTYCNTPNTCTDNVSTMFDTRSINNAYVFDDGFRDIAHRVDPTHVSWRNAFRHFSNNTTQIDGDPFKFVIYYYDWAGNLGEIIYSDNSSTRYGLPSITYDDLRPVLQDLKIKSDNWNSLPNNQYVAKAGDNVTVSFVLPSGNNLRNNRSLSIGQRNSTSYNSVSITSHGNDNYSGVYELTNSDLEGMLDFELFFQDKSGNFVIQRQNSRITNNCFVAGTLKYSQSSNCDNDTSLVWDELGNFSTSYPNDIQDQGFAFADNDSIVRRLTVYDSGDLNDEILFYDNSTLQTFDNSFVIFDRTPPHPYLALTWPTTQLSGDTDEWHKDERSLIQERISVYFKDLTGLLQTTANTYTGFDNLTQGFSSSGNPLSPSNCVGGVHLSDNSSNYLNCYSISSVGNSNNPSVNRSFNLIDIPIRPDPDEVNNFKGLNYTNHAVHGVTNDKYLQIFHVDLRLLDSSECPVRPLVSNQCAATLMPGNIFKVKLNTELSDLAGNIMSPKWLGGDFNTESNQTDTLPGETKSSFKTLERPYVSSTIPSDGDNGTFLNINPRITFKLPSKSFVNSTNSYYKLYTANRERMDNINTNYTIPNPTNNTPTSSLIHDCLSTDTPSTKGTISMEPYPDGGYDFAYYEESLLGTLTIRPNSELKPNTTYTITVNNDLDASSFCRPLEKIVLSDNFSFSFTTVDNVTPYLIGHYTFNSIDNQSLLDHSDPDGNWQDATFKQSGSAYSLVSSDLENGFDDETEGAVNFSNNFYAEISTTNSFNLSDNFSISLWFKNSNSDFPLVNWSSPNFSLGVRSQTPRLTQNQNLDCSSSIEVGYWNHLVVTVTDTEQKIYLNGNDCGTKNENGPFNYNNPLIRIGWDGGSNYSNGAIDELKFFNQILDDGEVKKLFINTGRSLEGYYPLGDKIDVSGSVRDLSGNDFHGRIRDQNKNVITSITAQQNYEKKSNRSSYFGRDRFVEVDYQESLNPEKFSLVGWIKPNNDLDTLEGIISSEHNDSINGNKGYGLYRWIYRSYKEIVSTDYNTDVRNSQDLFKRNGATEDSHENNGTCTQKRFRPSTSNMGSGPNLCEPPLNSNGTCADRDFKHLYAWTNPSPYTHIYENQGSIVCRGIDDPGTRLFEFWTRPAADFTDTSGSGKGKGPSLLNAPNYGFNIFYGRDESGNSKKLLSYDRRNNNDSTIQDSKLFLPVANNQIGAPDTFPYKIHEKDINNWIMFIAKWDGTQQKIQLRNYFDADNNPGKHEIFDNSSYQPVRNGASKLYIGHGYGDGFYSGDYKLNLFQGNIDDVRIYSRVISEDEIDTIFNLSDSEPPVPGNQGTVTKSGTCSLSWSAAEDDVTSTSNLKYKVIGFSGANRISTVESALINDTLNKNWTQNTSSTVSGLSGGYTNVLVKDEGGNMSLYDGAFCP